MDLVTSFFILQNSILSKKNAEKHNSLQPQETTEKAAITEKSLQQLLSRFGAASQTAIFLNREANFPGMVQTYSYPLLAAGV
ncbi:hypothetical protein ACFPVX_00130 [Cohnella faecalis]|uniref:Uncharacterized protein n=1 Tax=Cohnella faecalis TaxID=2315694 RepID=A0A398CR14_9BACL|nr:hypothetical protein [Cohnella faecalis]RIE02267.1 hypothetical protein D3H35_16175 [Cohnella faecalis]